MIKLTKDQVEGLRHWELMEKENYEKQWETGGEKDYILGMYYCFLEDEMTIDHTCRYDVILRLADKIREVIGEKG